MRLVLVLLLVGALVAIAAPTPAPHQPIRMCALPADSMCYHSHGEMPEQSAFCAVYVGGPLGLNGPHIQGQHCLHEPL